MNFEIYNVLQEFFSYKLIQYTLGLKFIFKRMSFLIDQINIIEI